MASLSKLGQAALYRFSMKYPKQQTLDDIKGMFSVFGMEPYDPGALSQYEHAAQTAMLAKHGCADEDVQIAAFLHEIGQMLPFEQESEPQVVMANKSWAKAGAKWLLSRGFSEKISILVENHDHAKRYLMYKYPLYISVNSNPSDLSFHFEADPMSEMEADAFQQQPYFELMIRMRRWDDAAKVPNYQTPDLEHFLAMIKRHLDRNRRFF